jgi:hypothetical protein
MPNPQNQKWEDMAWFEQVDLLRKLSLFPAITVMVFIRRRIGFRLLNPTWLIVLTFIMVVFTAFLPDSVNESFGFGTLLRIYALAMLGLGLFQRWQRWKELCSGKRWHTYSPGISYLEMLPLPPFLKFQRRVNRFLDPAAVAIIGFIIGVAFSHGLGVWIMFSAFFLYVYEQTLHEKQLAHDLDILDSMVSAEVQAETSKFFADGGTPENQPTIEDRAGIPTGLAPDIAKQVESRRAKRPPPPDNLAPETPASRV